MGADLPVIIIGLLCKIILDVYQENIDRIKSAVTVWMINRITRLSN